MGQFITKYSKVRVKSASTGLSIPNYIQTAKTQEISISHIRVLNNKSTDFCSRKQMVKEKRSLNESITSK